MKSVITAICLLIPLVIIFVIIDQKDFYSGDDVVVQQETITGREPTTVTVFKPVEQQPETMMLAETKSVTENKPTETKTGETKPVVETKLAEMKPSETKNAEMKLAETKPVAETKQTETKPLPETNEPVVEEKLMPVAIPILTQDEAYSLNESIKQEMESDNQYQRCVYFREQFLYPQTIKTEETSTLSNVQQTANWRFVAPKKPLSKETVAEKQSNFFFIKGNSPLEYRFILPLHENRMYSYTLGCRARGKGIITLSAYNSKFNKEFVFDSTSFKYVSFELGDGSSFQKALFPSILFQGEFQIESIVLYQNIVKGNWTVCLGTIEDISNVPDINKSDYPDCFYTAIFTTKDILDGEAIPEKIQLLIPAFMDRRIDSLSRIIKKGKYKLVIRPFSLATEHEQTIEQVDELESYEYTPYILVDAYGSSIPDLHTSGIPILQEERYDSPYDTPLNPQLEDKYQKDSQRIISQELKKMEEIVASVDNAETINSAFQQSWDEKQKKYDFMPDGKLIWANEQNSFFALPQKWELIHPQKMLDQNIEALVEFNHFLRIWGIQFIIQVVPNYQDIAALVLNPDYQKYGDQQSATVVKQLLENGIEAHYISDELIKNAFKYERLFDYPGDFHPDEGTADIMTTLMAQRLKQFGNAFPENLSSNLFSEKSQDAYIGIYFKWPSHVNIGQHEANTNVKVPYIYYDQKQITPDSTSKILVIGNSFISSPFSDAYIAYLAKKNLYLVSRKSMAGHGAVTGLIKLLFMDSAKILKGKKVVILPIAVSYVNSVYHFPNIKKMDDLLRDSNKSQYLFSRNTRDYCSFIFHPSTDLNLVPANPNITKALNLFLEEHPSAVLLSASRPSIQIPIPENLSPKTIQLSVCPIRYEMGASFFVDKNTVHLDSNASPIWETVHIPCLEGQTTVTISLDEHNSELLLGNISFYN